MTRYQGKRFAAFMFGVSLLTLGFFFGPVAAFSAFSAAMTTLLIAYCAGQSYTDAKNGNG